MPLGLNVLDCSYFSVLFPIDKKNAFAFPMVGGLMDFKSLIGGSNRSY